MAQPPAQPTLTLAALFEAGEADPDLEQLDGLIQAGVVALRSVRPAPRDFKGLVLAGADRTAAAVLAAHQTLVPVMIPIPAMKFAVIFE